MLSSNAYRTLLTSLKPMLAEYLESKGISTKANFKCINPEHQDDTPSCSLVPPERNRLLCFGCGLSLDIFAAAHLLEGLPTNGPEFLTENVFVLADRFGIPYESVKLSDEERRTIECFRAFELADSILTASEDLSVAKEIYDWDLAEIRKVIDGIGTIEWATFAKKMMSLGGYSQVYMETHFNLTPQLFGSNLLTLSIRNRQGNVIGFAARDKRYEKDNRLSKWKNTSSDVPIFKKGGVLYGLHSATDTGPLYLVEGYSDVIRLKSLGLANAIAYCSSSITENQASLLDSLEKYDLIIVPDRDKNGAGDKGITKSLDKTFVNFPKFRIKVKELPFPKKAKKVDPGEYLKTHTLKEFLALEDQEAFAWRLKRFPDNMSPEQIYDKAMPLVCEEKNLVRQQRMLRQLSEKTGVEYLRLQKALDEFKEERKKKGKQKAARLINSARTQLESIDPAEAPRLLRKIAEDVENAQSNKYEAQADGPEEFASFIQELKKTYENTGEGLPGWTTGFETFDLVFGGMPKKECMMTIAGDTNAGKSLVLQNLGLQIALRNKNTAVLLFSIDDSRSQTLPRLVAQMTGIPIAAVKNPNNPKYCLTEDHHKALELSWGDLKNMANHGRLDIKDASQSTDIEFMKSWIADTRQRHPNWDILFLLDSFNKLSGFDSEGREKVEQASDDISKLTKQEGITLICTAELRKRLNPMQRPYMDDVKNSNQIGYDSTVVILLHNSMHSNPSGKKDQVESWVDVRDNTEKPVIQLHVNKNKETSYKGMFRMRLSPNTSQLLEMSGQDLNDGWSDVGDAQPIL